MKPAASVRQIQHYVAGRPITSAPTRSLRFRADDEDILVPVATTAEVDTFVEEIGRHLARWMARPAAERQHLVAKIANSLLDVRTVIEAHAASFGMPTTDLARQLEDSARKVHEVVERARLRPAPPMGIVAFAIGSDRTGKQMLPLLSEVLVHGGVAVVTSSPELAAASSWMAGVLGGALPPGVINELYGDQETADALISNPLIAAVFVDGHDGTVDQLIRLAETHRKPGVAYARP